MKKANVSEAKSRLSRYLNEVQRGETVLIFDRNRPVARLVPVGAGDIPEDERVRALVRSGTASPPQRRLDAASFLQRPRPRLKSGVSASRALVEERSETR